MTIHHPAPVNQFYRLDKDTPTSPYVKVSRWNHIHATASGNVINWDSTLCMSTLGAICLDAHTGGADRSSPGRVHDSQYDQSGGIGVDDIKVALSRGWGETIYVPDDYDWADVIYAVRSQRRFCVIGVEYGLVPYTYQAQKGGDFPHAMGIDAVRATDNWIRVYDSLATNPRWMPQSAVRGAAEKLALEQRGTRGRLFVAFSKVRPLLTEVQFYKAVIKDTPLYSTPYGAKKSSVSLATYTVTRHSAKNPNTGVSQWWYQILPTAKTSNRGLWISPTRRTRITPL